jgi:plastocyanin
MRRTLAAAAVVPGLALAALPAAAGAAVWDVAAIDDALGSRWQPNAVSAAVGDTVQWSFGSAAANHDLFVAAPGVPPENAEFKGLHGPGAPAVTYEVTQPGEYFFYCTLHGGVAPGGMNGRVTVTTGGGGGGPAPGGPSPTVAPWPNNSSAPGAFEQGDTVRPTLTAIRVTGVRAGARLRFRLSEPGSVTVRFLRGRKVVKTARIARGAAGTNNVTVRDRRRLKAARYRVEVRATDRAGLESARWSGQVRIAG